MPTVAPRTGAWIETMSRAGRQSNDGSRPARARGLKHFQASGGVNLIEVAPRTGAWIETDPGSPGAGKEGSRPARARGLKPLFPPGYVIICTSRPARARGLKRVVFHVAQVEEKVAPRTGAWIETVQVRRDRGRLRSRPARARGLKHLVGQLPNQSAVVAPRTGAWIETG